MELTTLWCVLLSAAVAAAAYGGPPPLDADVPSGEREQHRDQPLPGKEIERVPTAAIPVGVDENPQLVRFLYAETVPLPVSLQQELGRASYSEEVPAEAPVSSSVEYIVSPSAENTVSPSSGATATFSLGTTASSSAGGAGAAGGSVAASVGLRDKIKILAHKVTSWLPNFSAYFPHLPTYLPGLDLELEAHQHPLKVPHIPGPTELLGDVNLLIEVAMEKLHRKHEEILELMKCTTPIPSQCQGLFQNIDKPAQPYSASANVNVNAASTIDSKPAIVLDRKPAATTVDGKPLLSFYAGFSKPEGQSHSQGVGFYVDNHYRPHLGHAEHTFVVPQKASLEVNGAGVIGADSAQQASLELAAPASVVVGEYSQPEVVVTVNSADTLNRKPVATLDGKYQLGLNAGVSKLEGHGHGSGLYVDNHYRPHLAHAEHTVVVPQKGSLEVHGAGVAGTDTAGVEALQASLESSAPASAVVGEYSAPEGAVDINSATMLNRKPTTTLDGKHQLSLHAGLSKPEGQRHGQDVGGLHASFELGAQASPVVGEYSAPEGVVSVDVKERPATDEVVSAGLHAAEKHAVSGGVDGAVSFTPLAAVGGEVSVDGKASLQGSAAMSAPASSITTSI